MKIIKFFAFVALVAVMAACSGNSAADVAAKIAKGQQLSEQDYSTMIDYCASYAKDAQVLQDKINLLPATSEEAGKLTDRVAALSDKFPYASEFFDKITFASEQEVGTSNVAKINSLSSLTWFSLPEWADMEPASDSSVVGEIVDMPSTDSTGVIASGDGEAVADTAAVRK